MSGIVVEKIGTLTGHRDCIYVLEQGTEDRYFYSSGGDGQIVRWDLKNPADGFIVAKVEKSVYTLLLLKDHHELLIAENFEGIHLVSLSEKKELRSSKFTDSAIFDVLHFGKYLFAACGNGELVVLDYPDLTTVAKIPLSAASLRSLAISPDGKCLVVAGSDYSIRILDLASFTVLQTLVGHTNSVFSLCYSPDGKHLLSVGRDAHLKVWSVTNEYRIQEDIAAHMYAINHVEYKPDGKYFATCSLDKSIKVWDAETFKLVKVIDKSRHAGHGTSVNKLLWSSYQDSLISCSDDRSISIWNIHFNSLKA